MHSGIAGIEVAEAESLGTEDEYSAGGVVGDGVGDRKIPVGDATVDDFEGRDRVIDGARTSSAQKSSSTRSWPRTNAISASALGCNSRSDGTSSSADTSISANSTPKSGWSTPSCCCTADDVSPILRPTTTAPAAIRRPISSCCTAYAVSMSVSPISVRMGGVGRPVLVASAIRSAASVTAFAASTSLRWRNYERYPSPCAAVRNVPCPVITVTAWGF